MQMRGGAHPTIYDVARAAGVAPSTVSRALSNPGRVSFDTAQHIRIVAQELGYRTRAIQRPLENNGALLAVSVADVTNPVFSGLIRGIQDAAAEAGLDVLLLDTHDQPEAEERLLEKIRPSVDGVILAGSRLGDATIRRLAKQLPVVLVHRVVPQVRSVLGDDLRAVRRTIEHLGELGHREVVYLAGPENSFADAVRWRGVREASLELEFSCRRLGPCAPTMQGGVTAYARWRERPSTAVLAYNDLMALGFLDAARRDGMPAPERVSVVGHDNILNGARSAPGLTTMSAPQAALGVTAVSRLLGRDNTDPQPVLLPVRLVVRGSTAPPANPA